MHLDELPKLAYRDWKSLSPNRLKTLLMHPNRPTRADYPPGPAHEAADHDVIPSLPNWLTKWKLHFNPFHDQVNRVFFLPAYQVSCLSTRTASRNCCQRRDTESPKLADERSEWIRYPPGLQSWSSTRTCPKNSWGRHDTKSPKHRDKSNFPKWRQSLLWFTSSHSFFYLTFLRLPPKTWTIAITRAVRLDESQRHLFTRERSTKMGLLNCRQLLWVDIWLSWASLHGEGDLCYVLEVHLIISLAVKTMHGELHCLQE